VKLLGPAVRPLGPAVVGNGLEREFHAHTVDVHFAPPGTAGPHPPREQSGIKRCQYQRVRAVQHH
jgi:hypothetical protein